MVKNDERKSKAIIAKALRASDEMAKNNRLVQVNLDAAAAAHARTEKILNALKKAKFGSPRYHELKVQLEDISRRARLYKAKAKWYREQAAVLQQYIDEVMKHS